MAFRTDKQTQDDLSIFNRNRGRSIVDIYNRTHTGGGFALLESMFAEPVSDYDEISLRIARIRYFHDGAQQFPFTPLHFVKAESYFEDTDERFSMNAGESRMLEIRLQRLLRADTDFQVVHNGVLSFLDILNELREYLAKTRTDECFNGLFPESREIRDLLESEEFRWAKEHKNRGRLSFRKTAEFDRMLRLKHRGEVRKILQFIYGIDVAASLAAVALSNNYAFPEVLPREDNILVLKDVFHPQLDNPHADNYLEVTPLNNVIFLTGANMAGKSTFMKSFAIAIYLAHMGLPVPAAQMKFSVRNGIYTSINLSDDLNWGYSHFYSEVMRIKKVVHELEIYRNIVIIFDELFRGTNVKDAYDGTIAVTGAFARVRGCIFMISTHILETAEVLQKKCSNVQFVYFPTVMDGNKPRYTYKLSRGITADRHGMIIIRNEGILEKLGGKQ